jgi:hypothetical protein
MKLFIASFVLFFLNACSQSVVKQADIEPVVHQVDQQQTSDVKPRWILSPEHAGYISVVGFSPKQPRGGEQAQYKVAMLKAQQELAQIVRVRVRNNTSHMVQESDGKATSSENINTSLETNTAIRLMNANVSAQWVDASDGGLYLLLEVPES